MYKQRKIVLVPFPYSGLSSSKRRPVLVVSNNEYNSFFRDVLVCVITSNRFTDDYSTTLEDGDSESGLLSERSVIKGHNLFTIGQSQILRRFRVVGQSKFEDVRKAVCNLIQTAA